MIYLNVKFYLRGKIKNPSEKFVWTQEMNDEFFKHLTENFSENEIYRPMNRAEIKQSFIDFFEPYGYISFFLKPNKISLKIFPYKMEPKNSRHLNTLMNMITESDYKIDFNYNDREDIIVIKHKLRRALYRYADEINDEQINKKELIKYAVRKAFALDDKDIILVQKRKIIIKLLQLSIRRELTEEASISNRYNGYDESELKKLSQEYFDEKRIDEFLRLVSLDVFKQLFVKKQINNKEYEKKIFPYIQNKIAEELTEITENGQEFRLGLAGYIFRVNFVRVFEYLSDEILKYVYLKDEYINNWLKYYDGAIFIDSSSRYTSPELLAPDGQKWNPVSIHGNIFTWFNIKNKIKTLNRQYNKITLAIEELLIDGKTPQEYIALLKEDKAYLKKDLDEINSLIEEKMDEKYNVNDKKIIPNINDEINELRVEVAEIKTKIEDVNKKISSIDTYNKYKKLEEQKISLKKDIKREENSLSKQKNSYLSIQSALVKALTSKRKLVK